MLTVIMFLISGMLSGFLLRKREKVIRAADQLTTWSIYLLLFLLGVSVGVREEIVSNIGKLGLQAVILTSGAIAGSVFASSFVYISFFKKERPGGDG
jgi:uncharacterized membrane protein YbjE (DUF340 family)